MNEERYSRADHVRVTEVDGEVFLVPGDGRQEVFYLDEISSGIWRLLEEPRTLAEMIDVYRTAFPDAPPGGMEADIQRLLADLVTNQLVRSA